MFNQNENFQLGIRKRRARIEEINLILAQPRPKGVIGGFIRNLIEERLHLEEAVAELEAERHRLELQKADELFRWEDLDQRLISPKTNDLAREMHERAAKALLRIGHETAQSGNSAGYLPRWIDFHEQLADEWAEKLYAAYCQAWTEQNRKISPTFIRAVRDRAIAGLIDARKSTVVFEAGLRAVRIGDTANPQNSAVIGEWTRKMDRLAARWNSKLEAEAVAAEYGAPKLSQLSPYKVLEPLSSVPDQSNRVLQSDLWRGFHDTFKVLAEEERKLEPRNIHDRWLRVHGSYEDKSLQTGLWQLCGGVNEAFKERFSVAATRAGMTLRSRPKGKPFEVWLHHVFLDLLEHKSKLLLAGDRDSGGIIIDLCEASATCCSRLEKSTLESESDSRSESSPMGMERAVISNRPPDCSKRGRTLVRSSDFVNFAGNLWIDSKRQISSAIVRVEELKRIACELDERGYVPPAKYLEADCATKLKDFNSKNSNSKTGPIQSWSRLVALDDKNHLRGMRRLLSRCAQTLSQ